MMPVRVAVPIPTSTDFAYNEVNWKDYAAALRACGADPVEFNLNLSPKEIAGLAGTCQAVLLPGSPADVTPEKFGQERDAATAPADLRRENVDELLLQDAHNLYKPILGICFGCQFLNVWRSGTLLQDLSMLPVNHAAGRSVAVAHTIEVEPGSLLEELAGATNRGARLPINSSHHQAIGIAGDGLRVSGRCPQDGVVEAVEGGQSNSKHFVLGLQWHPERTFHTDELSRLIFERFVQEAKAWTPRRILTSIAN